MKKYIALLIVAFMLTGCSGAKQQTQGPSASPVPGVSATPSTSSSDSASASSPAAPLTEIEHTAVNLVTDMANGKFKEAIENYKYDNTMKKAINESVLKTQIWEPLVQSSGKFKEITGTFVTSAKGYDTVSVKTTFENAKLCVNVSFDSNMLIAGLHCVPDNSEIKAPDGVTETAVKFGESGWELPGTLTIPKGEGPFPVVILVQGSGASDGDETVGPNKPFRDIAWGLARKGIATLRYDKRTFVYGDKMVRMTDMTVNQETVDDAALALKYLQTAEKIDKNRIFILGHSLGGMMMPRIAGLTPDAAGYIIMSGPVTPLEDTIVEQYKYLSELDGKVTDQEKQAIKSAESARDIIKTLKPGSEYSVQQLFNCPVSYWLDLKDYKPAETAKIIEKPLLILQGERDYQVTMRDFNLWKDALGDKTNVTMKSYPGLDHLYFYGTKKSDPQEYYAPSSVDNGVIGDIAAWVLK